MVVQSPYPFPIIPNDMTSTAANEPPSVSGFGNRQSRIDNKRAAIVKRNLIRWLIPDQPMIEMYVNPERISYSYPKVISPQRTKGGYITQYWGEDLGTLTISGTTGTSGIEGINVLRDIYRNEQLAMDPYVLAFEAQRQKDIEVENQASAIGSVLGNFAADAFTTLSDFGAPIMNNNRKAPPTLASLAFCVEMYYSGEVHRGYFTEFTITESAQSLGIFDYSLTFKSTQRRGMRNNFLGWHRSATHGPSYSNPQFGPPHSFKTLANAPGTTSTIRARDVNNQGLRGTYQTSIPIAANSYYDTDD